MDAEKSITTAEEMMALFPHLSSKHAKKLDLKIKARIAWDDREECILTYVRKVLTPIKKDKYKFNPNCKKLAEAYIKNNEKIVCHENLFCLLGLIASILLLLAEIMFEIFPCEWLELIFEPYILYPVALIAFVVMVKNEWIYKRDKLKDYLKLLSRNSTSLPFISSACFCIFLSTDINEYLRLGALLFCALIPCYIFFKSYRQFKVKIQY